MSSPTLPDIASWTDYVERHADPLLGLDAARAICSVHGLAPEPRRLFAGSNLLFRIDEGRWLKIYHPFGRDECAAETWALSQLDGGLPVPTPSILERGVRDGWSYLILSHVEGIGYDAIRETIPAPDRARIAADLGRALAVLHSVSVDGFSRPDLDWPTLLESSIASVAERVCASGAGAEWGRRAESFVARHADDLREARASSLVHGDLHADHVLVSNASGRWELCGLLDFADTMLAPREYELVDVLLFVMRGDREMIASLLDGFSVERIDRELAGRIVAWSLVHRWGNFAWWYAAEIAAGATSMEELADRMFPIGAATFQAAKRAEPNRH